MDGFVFQRKFAPDWFFGDGEGFGFRGGYLHVEWYSFLVKYVWEHILKCRNSKTNSLHLIYSHFKKNAQFETPLICPIDCLQLKWLKYVFHSFSLSRYLISPSLRVWFYLHHLYIFYCFFYFLSLISSLINIPHCTHSHRVSGFMSQSACK